MTSWTARASRLLARTPRLLARARVPLGFVGSALALWLAQPTWGSLALGSVVAAAGEGWRFWAAGHLEKGREVTRSGPYRWTAHPLYVGSAVIALGMVVAGRSAPLAILAVAYVVLAIGGAVRSEEAELRRAFGREYDEYREGRARTDSPVRRPFSLARALRNREHRAVTGLLAALGVFALKAGFLR